LPFVALVVVVLALIGGCAVSLEFCELGRGHDNSHKRVGFLKYSNPPSLPSLLPYNRGAARMNALGRAAKPSGPAVLLIKCTACGEKYEKK